MDRYFVLNKPYNMISQFVSPYAQKLLGDLEFNFPEGTHAVGRLDEASEGLLILTTDKSLTKRLLHPDKKHLRKYLVMVQREVDAKTVLQLSQGIEIEIKEKGKYTTKACEVKIVPEPKSLWKSEVEHNAYISYTWLEFILMEGKNRQIRKMCKAVKHQCRRLIRTAIENLELGELKPGQIREIEKEELFALLKLNNEATKE